MCLCANAFSNKCQVQFPMVPRNTNERNEERMSIQLMKPVIWKQNDERFEKDRRIMWRVQETSASLM